jgi:hypothetical protein
MSTMEELRALLAAMEMRAADAEKHAIEAEKLREIKTLVFQKEASTKHIKGLENRLKIITRDVKKLKKALTAMHSKKCAADAKEAARFEGMFKHLEGDMF